MHLSYYPLLKQKRSAFFNALLILAMFLGFCSSSYSASVKTNDAKPPMKVKVVVVSMFEIGSDEGDAPGEFQLWKARQKLTTQYPLPHGFHDIYANPDTGVIGMVTGMGIARASAAIMALGLDPRFDLSQAYWLVAGIAGVDPADNTIGSAIWTDYVVDGDLAHQIDAREIPSQWSTGYFPLFTHAPFENADAVDVNNSPNGEVYALNLPLAKWAYSLTKDTKLLNNEAMDALRAKYTNSASAKALPNVSMGAHLSASTFWHGEKLNTWANDWVAYWTQGKGNFVTSGMEDSATLQSLSYLDNAGLVNKDRLLILRTASNFTMQPPSLSAAENLKLESSGDGYAAMGAAIEAAYKVGSQVTDYIVTHWETVKDTPPSAE
ncbi:MULTISPECIES: purine nucleoside permease [Alteromonas]|uniref:purine nucleoside permease n=1 Tax=Alteromonas TaxID=226 RepID=UPI00127AA8C5|nr:MULTISPECIES: purine nucleoside permease [Alteromonas]CAI2389645.1 Purine nucleoside permease [Alteromonas macleodii]CAI3948261.1 Purine nucleoside permease [Alteromonas macleodii]CAI3949212.1 Purine nucleoside permease [Alteromonas macleodii]CAI3949272.1 Purine nucleoside permease [Alteromonas macleodii]VTO39241.1 Purine nucleoside permease [Alteromonas macleodii]